ncbi:MAG: hypothetical protein ACTSXX_07565 [Candidatus Baldrarchaeia archaeon]
MGLDKLLERIEKIVQNLKENPELYDQEKLNQAVSKFEESVRDAIKFPDHIKRILDELSKLHLRTLQSKIKKLNLKISGRRKKEILYNIGIYLLKNKDAIQLIEENILGSKVPKITKEEVETWKDWIKMTPEQLEKHLQSLTVKQIRTIAKTILSSKDLRKRKKELIKTIIFRLEELKAHVRMGPS